MPIATAHNVTLKPFLGVPAVLLLLTLGATPPAQAQTEGRFTSGTLRFSGSASASSGYGGSNFQLGLGAGYYLMDGLELGLDARSWFGGNTNVYEVEPAVTYVFTNLGSLKPYGGALYRRTFIEGRDDLSAYGGRAGIFLQQSRNLHIRAGLVGIRHQNCDSSSGADCSDFYPEVSAGFYF